jgi:hypothetical protein
MVGQVVIVAGSAIDPGLAVEAGVGFVVLPARVWGVGHFMILGMVLTTFVIQLAMPGLLAFAIKVVVVVMGVLYGLWACNGMWDGTHLCQHLRP